MVWAEGEREKKVPFIPGTLMRPLGSREVVSFDVPPGNSATGQARPGPLRLARVSLLRGFAEMGGDLCGGRAVYRNVEMTRGCLALSVLKQRSKKTLGSITKLIPLVILAFSAPPSWIKA